MKTTYSLLLLFLLISCSTYKKDRFSYNYDSENLWINSYKYEAFYGCMKEGLKNDSLRIILQNTDLFNPSGEIDFNTIDGARKNGELIILNAPKPFVKLDLGEENLLNKNFNSFNCLNYFASRELDSIARKEYKKYLMKDYQIQMLIFTIQKQA